MVGALAVGGYGQADASAETGYDDGSPNRFRTNAIEIATSRDTIVTTATKRGVRSGIGNALGGLPCEAGYTTTAGEQEEV